MENQKWPHRLTIIRHAQSAYNILKGQKKADPLYQQFSKSFNKNYRSPETVGLAHQVLAQWGLQTGDHDTDLAPKAEYDAILTGQSLRNVRALPNVVFVSPYYRTHKTLAALIEGWPELATVPQVEEVRIREQEHGLALLYSDWRVFFALHPEQKVLQDIQNQYWYRYPQGENIPDVQLRLKDFQATLVREYAAQDVLMVTHHLSILALRMNLERFDWKEFLRIDREEKPINCGVTTYTSSSGTGRGGMGKLVLQRYNECLYREHAV